MTAFLDSIGYGAVDAGPLAEGWRQQPGTPVYGAPYGPFDDEKGHAGERRRGPGGAGRGQPLSDRPPRPGPPPSWRPGHRAR